MIRAFFCAVTFVVFLIWTIPVKILILVLRKLRVHGAANRLGYFIARFFLFVPLKVFAGVKLSVRGSQYLPGWKDPGVLFVGNHCSYFDIILSFCAFNTCTGYVGKKELAKFPLLGTWMLAIGCILLDRSNIKDGIRMADTAAKHIGNGISMAIFPEGTRNKHEDEQLVGEFHGGSLRIAQKALCKVIPMAITGTADIFEKHFPAVKAGKVIIEFLEPIDASTLDRPQLKGLAETTRNLILEARQRHVQEM